MAIKASLLPGARALMVFGDELDNTITESRDAAGSILINGGAVGAFGGKPTVVIYAPQEDPDRCAHVRATRKVRIWRPSSSN